VGSAAQRRFEVVIRCLSLPVGQQPRSCLVNVYKQAKNRAARTGAFYIVHAVSVQHYFEYIGYVALVDRFVYMYRCDDEFLFTSWVAYS